MCHAGAVSPQVRRALVGLATAGLVAGTAFLAVLLLNVTLYLEPSGPSESELPELPPGLAIGDEPGTRIDTCGSGSCYREFDVVGEAGESAAEVRARLPVREECGRRSLVDWRPRCVGYDLRAGRVRGYVSIGAWLD
ncbi:hypothetical protein CCO04_20630 [Pimelobacter sp. 30-1]|nr:hypothetical protein [Pimelobacter sp. 30-1]